MIYAYSRACCWQVIELTLSLLTVALLYRHTVASPCVKQQRHPMSTWHHPTAQHQPQKTMSNMRRKPHHCCPGSCPRMPPTSALHSSLRTTLRFVYIHSFLNLCNPSLLQGRMLASLVSGFLRLTSDATGLALPNITAICTASMIYVLYC